MKLVVLVLAAAFALHTASAPRYTTQGPWILDGQGRHLVLRGLDVTGGEDTPTSRPLPYGPADFQAIRATGATVVRVPIAWALIEPTRGHIDPAALARVHTTVGWAIAAGLRVVLDMHQYLWSPCLGGNGIPAWAVPNCPAKPATNILTQELSAFAAETSFWQNAALQADLAGVWVRVARAVGQPPELLGYDLFNEPAPGFIPPEVFETRYLVPLYRTIGTKLRAVDPGALLFVESSILDGIVNGSSQFLGPIGLDRVVYEPHQYGAVSFNADGILGSAYDLAGPAQFAPDLTIDVAIAQRLHAAIWLGEWGAITDRTSHNPTGYIADDTAAQDGAMMGSAYWSNDSLSRSDRAELTRIVPFAIAGTPSYFTTGTSSLRIAWRPDGGTTVISVPAGRDITVHVLAGDVSSWTVRDGWLTVTAPAQGGVLISVSS